MGHSWFRISGIARWFPRDRRATVAIMFSLLLVPILAIIGAAIDYGYTTRTKAQLDLIADSTSMVAVTTAANYYQTLLASASSSNADQLVGEAVVKGQTVGQAYWAAQAAQLGAGVNAAAPVIDFAQQEPSGKFEADVSYSATADSFFGGVLTRFFGYPNTFKVPGKSNAIVTVAAYVDVFILVDASSSMDLPANESDMNAAIAATNAWTDSHINDPACQSNPSCAQFASKDGNGQPIHNQCALGCHFNSSGDDFYSAIKNAGIPVRSDVLKADLGQYFLSPLSARLPTTLNVAIYKFSKALSVVHGLDNNVSAALTDLTNIPPSFPSEQSNDTHTDEVMSAFSAIVPASGSGMTASDPKVYFIFATDGFVDDGEMPNRLQQPLNPADCAPFAAKGITVVPLYLNYSPVPGGWYQQYVEPHMIPTDQMAAAMQACSPQHFMQAADAASLQTALSQLVNTIHVRPNPGIYIR